MSTTTATAPSSGATADKYDRQLRLWGASGQKALSDTTVVLIRATAAGTETLKNLILPGIGRFVVIDDVVIDTTNTSPTPTKDYASNFFVPLVVNHNIASINDAQSTTISRAQVACQCLQELNPDVHGTHQHVNNLTQMDFKALFLSSSSSSSSSSSTTNNTSASNVLVIASDLEPLLMRQVAETCLLLQIPLLRVHSYGLLGIVQIQSPLRPLLRPQSSHGEVPDLRLVHPFPALQALSQTISWSDLDSNAHGHVPYPLILLHIQDKWKSSHEGQLPRSLEERQQFVQLIQQESRNYDAELNFQEAVQNAYLAYTEPRKVDLDEVARLQQMLETSSQNSSGETTPSSSFTACQEMLAMLSVLKIFLQQFSRPPLHGSIPDITASTELYVQLQQVYRDQAAADLQAMRQLLQEHYPQQPVSDDNLVSFCQNVTHRIDVYDTGSTCLQLPGAPTSTAMANASSSSILEDLADAATDPYEAPEHTPLVWYLAFQACQAFYQDHNRYPGCFEENAGEKYEKDITQMQSYLQFVCQSYPSLLETELIQQTLLLPPSPEDPNNPSMSHRIAQECTRWANAELHAIASIVGGVASQEAVKLITGQFIPLNNTYVYHGICSVGAVYKF